MTYMHYLISICIPVVYMNLSLQRRILIVFMTDNLILLVKFTSYIESLVPLSESFNYNMTQSIFSICLWQSFIFDKYIEKIHPEKIHWTHKKADFCNAPPYCNIISVIDLFIKGWILVVNNEGAGYVLTGTSNQDHKHSLTYIFITLHSTLTFSNFQTKGFIYISPLIYKCTMRKL